MVKAKIFPQVSPGSHAQKYTCPLCQEVLPSQKEFTTHIRGHNEVKPCNDPNDPTGQAKVYYCCLCGKMLSSFSSLDRHMLVHSGERPFSCQYCGQTFTTNGNMHRHKRTHGNHRDSRESDTSSGGSGSGAGAKKVAAAAGRKRKNSLDQGAPVLPPTVTPTPSFPEVPTMVKKTPDHRDVLKMQMAAAAAAANAAAAVGVGKPCPVCKDLFFTEMSLEAHIVTVHAGQEVQCDECPFKASYSLLKMHKGIYHHKSFASFPTLSALNAMSTLAATSGVADTGSPLSLPLKKEEPVVKKTKEEQPPAFNVVSPVKAPTPVIPQPTPPSASVAASNSPRLSKNTEPALDSGEHFDECEGALREMKLKGEFPCRVCPAVYPNLRALKGHNKEHMNKAPYECNVADCQYSSSDKCTLARHMRTHTGEKPFECKDCNFGFTTKANCERHVKNKHGKNSRAEVRESIVVHDIDDVDLGSGKMDVSFDDSQSAGSPMKMGRKPLLETAGSVELEETRKAQPKASLFAPYSASLFRQVNEEKAADSTTNSDGGSDAPLDLSRPVVNTALKVKDNYEAQSSLKDDVFGGLAKPFGLPSAAPTGLPTVNPLAAAAMAGQMPLPFLFQHLAAAQANNGTSSPLDPTAYLLAYQDMVRRQQAMQQQQQQQQQQQAAAAAAVKDPASFLMHLSTLQSNLSSATTAAAASSPIAPHSPLAATKSPFIKENGGTVSSSSPSSLSSGSGPSEALEKPVAPSMPLPGDNEADYKMVIKNGVLMKKQKQRRYRTERPHGCDYCNARFTLRSNMDRHVKQQHPENWNKFKAKAAMQMRTVDVGERTEMELEDEEMEGDDEDDELMDEVDAPLQPIEAKENDVISCNEAESKPSATDDVAVDMDASSDSQSDPGYLDNEDEVDFGSGSEDSGAAGGDGRKKSAYSAAPHRIPCPHCPRSFPWTSSLERHILTHTGEKPYKCDECPLWFTTKSNCDRHLIRKHGNNNVDKEAGGSDVSASLPIKQGQVPERPFKCSLCPSSTFSSEKKLKKHQAVKHCPGGGGASSEESANSSREADEINVVDEADKADEAHNSSKGSTSSGSSSSSALNDCPFKCHLCDEGFPERKEAIEHVKSAHAKKFEEWVARGAFDVAPIDEASLQQQIPQQQQPDLDAGETFDQIRGKFPDYVNRKIICLFCLRKFWSAEDLRRHVRSHTGDRPYTCDICHRKFSLKHSMLRHRKKHDSGVSSGGDEGESDSDSGGNGNGMGPASVSSPDEEENRPANSAVLALKKRANLMDTIKKLSTAAVGGNKSE